MHLRTSQILELLEEDRTRYIEHDAGYYRMKEMNGDAVTVSENGELFAVDPDQTDMDDLVDHSQLVRDGSRYRLPQALPPQDVEITVDP